MPSYSKLAYTLIIAGMSIFAFERFGLQAISSNGTPVHLNGALMSILVIAPVVLVIAGCGVFMVGRMRRLK